MDKVKTLKHSSCDFCILTSKFSLAAVYFSERLHSISRYTTTPSEHFVQIEHNSDTYS